MIGRVVGCLLILKALEMCWEKVRLHEHAFWFPIRVCTPFLYTRITKTPFKRQPSRHILSVQQVTQCEKPERVINLRSTDMWGVLSGQRGEEARLPEEGWLVLRCV